MPKRYKKYRARKGSTTYERPYNGEHVNLAVQASGIFRRDDHAEIPSKGVAGVKINKAETSEDLSQEMAEREALARAEADRRKKMIAPMYNKGAYQYIGGVDEAILHDIGKKK